MTQPPANVTELRARLAGFRYSAFRLETLQVYRGSGEDALLAAFRAGADAPPQDPRRDAWDAMVRAHRHAGRVLQRVHVVVEPLSEYMRFELTWQYGPNTAVGADIRIIPVASGGAWPDDVPHCDFWLFDGGELFDAVYDDDGTWQGVHAIIDSARIVQACRWREAAPYHAVPWRDYIESRPELADRVPGVA